MRRGAGIGALKKRNVEKQRFDNLGSELEAANEATMQEQLGVFQTNLADFATKHKSKINENPVFRAQFNRMCSSIGVDPLASTRGFWAQALGVGDFYYTLAVQIIEVCMLTRPANGGLISMAELLRRLRQLRGRRANRPSPERSGPSTGGPDTSAISEADVRTAVNKVGVLGNGFRVVSVGSQPMVLSVPMELATDSVDLLTHARAHGGRLVPHAVATALAWDADRVKRAVETLLRDGMCWVDSAPEEEQEYWIPSVWQEQVHAKDGSATTEPTPEDGVNP